MKQKIKIVRYQIIRELSKLNISNSTQEAEMLLCHLLHRKPVWLSLNSEKIISEKKLDTITKVLNKRLAGEPLPYILGETVFYDIKLKINNHVLIPRFESELLVNEALKIISKRSNLEIVDIGTGSGAIAIAVGRNLKKRRVEFNISALDISDDAIKIAKTNIKNYKLDNKIQVIKSNLLEKINSPADIFIANLPYVPTKDICELADPQLALDGGPDGTAIIKKLLKQIHDRKLIKSGGSIILEIGHNQAKKISKKAFSIFHAVRIKVITDLAGYDRVLIISTSRK